MSVLPLYMPQDPVRAQAVRQWAVEKGIELDERGYTPDRFRPFPYECPKGHEIRGDDDVYRVTSRQRLYQRCRACHRDSERGRWQRRKAAGYKRK